MDINYYKQYEPIFGAWHITRLIGEGSFGKVFEMEREDFGVVYKAALKAITIPTSESEVRSVMSEGMDEGSVRTYFGSFVKELVQEFALMSKLKGNSNVVSYENHQVMERRDGIGWDILIQMELLTPLDDYIRQKKSISRQEIMKLGIDLCKALELCQKHNIIHRDIKPENIFISENGDFKLGDFGVARTVEKTTGGLSKKGTYPYMAPEVYKGEAYGSTVDIYSLGLVLYRLLNGNRTPFLPLAPAPVTHADRENALAKRFNGAPLPMPSHAEGRLGEIVLKACAFDPKDRYSSPMQMRQELEAILYNREESRYIYPEGDEVPQKSVQYIRTGDEPPVAQIEVTQKDARTVGGLDGTVSDFGKTISDFGGTASDVSGRTVAQKKAEVSSEPKKRGKKLWIAVGAAGLLVIVLAVALFSKGGSGAETLPSADPTQIIRDEQGNIVQEPISESIYAVYEYGEDGHRIREIYYNVDGTLEYYYLYAYSYYFDGTPAGYYLQEYDENGKCTKENYYNVDGTLNCYYLYEYDGNGNKTKNSTYNADGTLNWYDLYEYDGNGNTTKSSEYNADGTLNCYYLYEYDGNGNTTKLSFYNADGMLSYHMYEYDENGNTTKLSFYNADGTLNWYYLYEYDGNGNTTKSSRYNADGTLDFYDLYEYDEAGDLVITAYNPDGTPR